MAALLNGRVELRAGNGPEAARALRRATAITEDLWSQTKSDWHCQELIEDLIYLGDAEKLAGNAAAARQQHVHAHALALVQAKLYPGTWITALLLAQTYVRLAELQPDPRPFRELARQTLAAIGEDRLDGEGRALLRTLH